MIFPDGIEIELSFFEAGSSAQLMDGSLHCKTTPYAIFAQAVSGRYEIECDGRTERVERGEAFLTAPNRPMRIMHRSLSETKKTMEARWLHFDFRTLGGLDALSLFEMPLRVPAKEAAPLGRLAARALALKSSQANPLLLAANRMEIAAAAFRLVAGFSTLKEGALELLSDARLAELCAAIRKEPGRRYTVEKLAKAAKLSAPRLHSYLRERLQTTPMGLVRKIRLRLAAQALLSSEIKLDALAKELGFANQFHFSRLFKGQYAESPREYRLRRYGASG